MENPLLAMAEKPMTQRDLDQLDKIIERLEKWRDRVYDEGRLANADRREVNSARDTLYAIWSKHR